MISGTDLFPFAFPSLVFPIAHRHTAYIKVIQCPVWMEKLHESSLDVLSRHFTSGYFHILRTVCSEFDWNELIYRYASLSSSHLVIKLHMLCFFQGPFWSVCLSCDITKYTDPKIPWWMCRNSSQQEKLCHKMTNAWNWDSCFTETFQRGRLPLTFDKSGRLENNAERAVQSRLVVQLTEGVGSIRAKAKQRSHVDRWRKSIQDAAS